jgi:starch phosphorylase
MHSDQPFTTPFIHPFTADKKFTKSVAYFSMEYAIDQSLKIYSGGLGFLAGSHMRSAYALNQNLIGIGMLWKYGYYDQDRKRDNSMEVEFREKIYHFLIDTKIRTAIDIGGQAIWVNAYYLPPEIFKTAPLFFLTTNTEGNDYNARSISYSLYDSNPGTKTSQCIVPGIGGAKLLDALGYTPDVYHFNEAHALPGAFQLLQKYKTLAQLKKRLVFHNAYTRRGRK